MKTTKKKESKQLFSQYNDGKSIARCGGKCVTGPDRSMFLTSALLILIPQGLFFGFV